MLVLSRQRDEQIVIGDNIVLNVVEIRGDKVRLGIDAPREVSVDRKEVYEAIQREGQKTVRHATQEFEQAQMHDVIRPKPMSTYSISGEIDGVVHTERIKAEGPAEAIAEIVTRFENVKIVSLVDVTAEAAP